jgi:hypothetical protein
MKDEGGGIRCRCSTLLLLLSAAAFSSSAQQPAPPAAAIQQAGSGIGYKSVAAALEGLKARKDVEVFEQGGWTMADDRADGSLWSFTPRGHPAHPAAVKRTITRKDGKTQIEMTALCQAERGACDRLIDDFQELNMKMGEFLRSQEKTAPAGNK